METFPEEKIGIIKKYLEENLPEPGLKVAFKGGDFLRANAPTFIIFNDHILYLYFARAFVDDHSPDHIYTILINYGINKFFRDKNIKSIYLKNEGLEIEKYKVNV